MNAVRAKPSNQQTPQQGDAQLRKLLSRTDWGEIQELLEKKTYQRKFQIIEAFTELVTKRGLHHTSHAEIAKACGITRQLVDHHFPDDSALFVLSFKYIYAGFQKFAADGLMAKVGLTNQLEGYIDGVVRWMSEKQTHARFLVQFYAVVQLDEEISTFFERNLKIGRERITALLLCGQKEGLFQGMTEELLSKKATAIQIQIFGFLIYHSWKNVEFLKAREELLQSSFALLGIRSR